MNIRSCIILLLLNKSNTDTYLLFLTFWHLFNFFEFLRLSDMDHIIRTFGFMFPKITTEFEPRWTTSISEYTRENNNLTKVFVYVVASTMRWRPVGPYATVTNVFATVKYINWITI